MKEKKDNKLLLCLDVDGTIFFGHLSNYIGEKLIEAAKAKILTTRDQIPALTIQYTEAFLSDSNLSWRNKTQLLTLIKKAWLSGDEVSLVSFNEHPEAVKYAMTKLIGKEEIEKIHINSYMPEETKTSEGKQQHIKGVMDKIGITRPENVLLVEDSRENVDIAIKALMNAIHIDGEENKDFSKALDFLQEFNTKQGINIDLDESLTESVSSDSSNNKNLKTEEGNMMENYLGDNQDLDNRSEGGHTSLDETLLGNLNI